jgi:superfamily II DNA or RNA helicase
MRDDTRAALAKHRRAILCAPPGTGKTRLAKWIMGAYANREKREGESGNAIFAVHRRGLVDNASSSFNEDPVLPHGLIMAGNDTSQIGAKVYVIGVTMIRYVHQIIMT